MMYSPAKAADKAGVSRKTIMNSIISLDLPAHRNNQNFWMIRPTDLANWIREREKNRPQTRDQNASVTQHLDVSTQHELDTLRAQLEITFVTRRLEASERDNEKLKQEVKELKAELKESRNKMDQVWREVTNKLLFTSRHYTRQEPFLLTQDMRISIGNGDITNIFLD